MTELSKFRYPGAKNFTTEQAHLFMGRDDDKEMLYQMIIARQIVVLYGKSGMGKSSLLNAGIIPLLENELDRKPKYFSIRLFNKGQENDSNFLPQLQTIIQTVSENVIEKAWLKPLKIDNYPKGELWYWLEQ